MAGGSIVRRVSVQAEARKWYFFYVFLTKLFAIDRHLIEGDLIEIIKKI